MKSILIRAIGSKDIGMGHLSRACLLADFISQKKEYTPILVINDNQDAIGFVSKRFKSNNVHLLKESLDDKTHAKELSSLLSHFNSQTIIFDLLEHHFEGEFLACLKKENKDLFISSIIDDSYYREVDVDLVLNGNPLQVDKDYSHLKTTYLLGPKYFLMDEGYAHKEASSKKNSCIVLTLGGSDHNNLVFKVLDAIESIEIKEEIIIATSRATGYIDKLKEKVQKSPKKISVELDLNGLMSLWEKASFAITAGGNTLFERIALGVPGVTICQLTRQMEIANQFQKLGANANIGFGPELTTEQIREELKKSLNSSQLREQQISCCAELGIGNGLHLFYKQLTTMLN